MYSIQHNILLVEDSSSLAHLYQEYMVREGFSVSIAQNGEQAMQALSEDTPSAIVLDLLLPDMNGLEILRHVKAQMPEVPVIVATMNNSIEVAIEAMQMGAYDFIIKPFTAPRLTYTLFNALKIKNLEDELNRLHTLTHHIRYLGIVGQSPQMQHVYQTIDVMAQSRAPVFIEGETGTGKELIAETLHHAGPRREKPFITLNCNAVPPADMDAVLFGDVNKDQHGAARSAHGATLYINEICSMPIDLQVKLLRFMHTGAVCPTGSNETDNIDVRIIASTSCHAPDAVNQGLMYEDLFHQLYIIPVQIPPLRERGDDILILASHFMSRFNKEEHKNFTGLSPDVTRLFRQHEWPGNVRQLEHVIHRIVAMHHGTTIEINMLPDDLMQTSPQHAELPQLKILSHMSSITEETWIDPLWKVEKNAILTTLDYTGHDIPKAAALLEISPTMLYQKLQMWRGIGAPGERRRNVV